jgi:hypothetical protein
LSIKDEELHMFTLWYVPKRFNVLM